MERTVLCVQNPIMCFVGGLWYKHDNNYQPWVSWIEETWWVGGLPGDCCSEITGWANKSCLLFHRVMYILWVTTHWFIHLGAILQIRSMQLCFGLVMYVYKSNPLFSYCKEPQWIYKTTICEYNITQFTIYILSEGWFILTPPKVPLHKETHMQKSW